MSRVRHQFMTKMTPRISSEFMRLDLQEKATVPSSPRLEQDTKKLGLRRLFRAGHAVMKGVVQSFELNLKAMVNYCANSVSSIIKIFQFSEFHLWLENGRNLLKFK